MTLSDFRRITDELLSAYIDDEVTEQERDLIEAAIAQDEEIAWRLNSLRQTVVLLRDLPEMALPRSFTLTLDQVRTAPNVEKAVGVGATEQQLVAMPAAPAHGQRKAARPSPAKSGFWEQVVEVWRGFWQGGNPMLRNAAAVSFALLLTLLGSGQMLTRALQPVGMVASSPAAAPAVESGEAAPAAAVAIAPTAATGEDAAANKAPVEESARTMQAEAAPANDTAAGETTASDTASSDSAESTAAQAAPAEADSGQEGESALTQDAPPAQESAAAAAVVPSEPLPTPDPLGPPMAAAPFPGAGMGAGGGQGGGGPGEPAVGGGGEAGGLVPEQAYGFDANPEPTPLPAEEAVSASVAAAPPAAAASAADVAVTPAVEVTEAPQTEAMAAAAEEPATEENAGDSASDSAVARSAEPAVEESAAASEQPVTESAVEPTATPEAVALVAPGPITSSDVVENVESEGAVPTTSPGANLPVVWIAQGSALLLTVFLASLWWRSRRRTL